MHDASPEARVRVASWNIHGSIGRDRRCDSERTVRVIEAMNADIVALQEVDGRTHLRRRPNAFETLERLLGGYRVEARLIGEPGREHGNLLWCRWPIEDGKVHLLPGGLEQRGVIEGRIGVPGGRAIAVFATHLGLSPFVRRRQAEAIVRHVESRAHEPSIVLGDLNEWASRGPVHRSLSRALPLVQQPRTFPARWPRFALDRLYGSAGIRAVPVAVPEAAAQASDHLPLIVDLFF